MQLLLGVCAAALSMKSIDRVYRTGLSIIVYTETIA